MTDEWLKKMADLEDTCNGSPSVGGLAHELGLYIGKTGTLPCRGCGAAVTVPSTLICPECIQKEISAAQVLAKQVEQEHYRIVTNFIDHPKFRCFERTTDRIGYTIYRARWDGGEATGFTIRHACEEALKALNA